MKKIITTILLLTLIALNNSLANSIAKIPANINHAGYDKLLKKYVNNDGLVNYKNWKANSTDLNKLNNYLKQFGTTSSQVAAGLDEVASFTNLYNSLTIKWILSHYPVASIKKTKKPWKEKRHTVGGKKISLDDIEHEILRPIISYKAHAILVCAAKSCPPLQNSAYTKSGFNQQVETAFKVWLSRSDLNKFLPSENLVYASKIFDWYGKDFKGENSLKSVFSRYAPKTYKPFLLQKSYRIKYLKYNWNLNAQ